MRKLLLFLFFFVAVAAHAQNFDLVNYAAVNTPTNGVKIKTNLPAVSGSSMMPTIFIRGYSFGNAGTINLTLCFYYYNNTFTFPKVSSSGTYTPAIKLAQENGKIVIFIDSKVNYQRFNVSAFGSGLQSETAANYSGWTAVDSTLISEAGSITSVPYANRIEGTAFLPDSVTVTSDGKLGISTLTPKAPLDISTTMPDTMTAIVSRLPDGNSAGRGTFLGVRAGTATASGNTSFSMEHYFYGLKNSSINFVRGAGQQGGFLTFSTNDGTEKMRVDASGNVGIGTTNTGNFKLAVNGTIGAKKLTVTATGWADFVFQKGYELPSLREVSNYIDVHQHLPGVPSAAEVAEKGVDVGEMNKVLLQKVEELTLYLIQQQQAMIAQQERIEALERKVKTREAF